MKYAGLTSKESQEYNILINAPKLSPKKIVKITELNMKHIDALREKHKKEIKNASSK